MTTVHAFYSHDPEQTPEWAYRSHPISCYGLADSLRAARLDFREALQFSLDDGEDAPNLVEHVETRHPLGFWIRVRIGEQPDAGWRDYVARVLANTIDARTRGGRDVNTDTWGTTATGEPVVVACLPIDTIESVIDQLQPSESCAIALAFPFRDEGLEVSWVSGIIREHAEPIDRPVETLKQAGLSPDSTIEDFMNSTGVTRATMVERAADGRSGEGDGAVVAKFALAV
ncbi:hypothetical protein QNA19_08760 [Rhodococcus fascians]|uniref:hypothetical protein n=1 Tax=Rhodococcoides fascians TaxID=1828 RepID=UPI0024BB3215|nr:hypothetical protein [Rhodococcus fascians]MDJ0426006.1 hypothetical protein [Rhodococcus fascians]